MQFNLLCDDDTFNPETSMWRYYELINEAAEKFGRPLTPKHPFRQIVAEAGFANLQEKVFKLPLGTWPADPKQKELGRWFQLVGESGFEAHGLALLTRVLGMEVAKVKALIDGCRAEMRSRKVHGYATL